LRAVGKSILLFVSGGLASGSSSARGYRPFDAADRAVAELRKFEVEMSPMGFRHDDWGRTWIVPQLRLNDGLAEGWEVVLPRPLHAVKVPLPEAKPDHL